MKLSGKALRHLAKIISGDNKVSPYRTGPELTDFFHDFGERDLYGQGFPSRYNYTLDKIKKFNGTDTMKGIVCAAFDFWQQGFDPENEALQFNKIIAGDGYRLVKEHFSGFMQGNDYIKGEPYLEVRSLGEDIIAPEALSSISHTKISEQFSKANRKISEGDFSGAIASAYTLVEHLLKLLLEETKTPYKQDEGDIRRLYNLLRKPLCLDPSSDAIAAPLKPILDGFQKIVGGLYEISNKASDRHARRFNPADHHAKLAVNAAFALSEFLVQSHAYQKAQSAETSPKGSFQT